MGQFRNHTTFWLGNLNRRDHSQHLDVDGSIILKWFLSKECGKVWTVCIWLKIGTSDGML